jgi:hypothetical protein
VKGRQGLGAAEQAIRPTVLQAARFGPEEVTLAQSGVRFRVFPIAAQFPRRQVYLLVAPVFPVHVRAAVLGLENSRQIQAIGAVSGGKIPAGVPFPAEEPGLKAACPGHVPVMDQGRTLNVVFRLMQPRKTQTSPLNS